ncbi:hypothetical protein D779_2200 [Imhoffiella purpurea]|uniref:Uncharacterized protein n=1 Tax=Imhoffiella purpurea TaxID=1249627 RepID=W9VCF7_9GAMM|nr:hypothetical protein D779_2200 [Imhoffiella purpurea]
MLVRAHVLVPFEGHDSQIARIASATSRLARIFIETEPLDPVSRVRFRLDEVKRGLRDALSIFAPLSVDFPIALVDQSLQ